MTGRRSIVALISTTAESTGYPYCRFSGYSSVPPRRLAELQTSRLGADHACFAHVLCCVAVARRDRDSCPVDGGRTCAVAPRESAGVPRRHWREPPGTDRAGLAKTAGGDCAGHGHYHGTAAGRRGTGPVRHQG